MDARETDRLAHRLAWGTAQRTRRPMAASRALALAALAALPLTTTLCIIAFGRGIDPRRPLGSVWFLVKIVDMSLLAASAIVVLRDVVRPDSSRLRIWTVLPGVGLLLLGVVADRSGLPLHGRVAISVPTCCGAIVALSLPGLALILWTLQAAAAVTRPRLEGAVGSLLAGAISGMACALACRKNGGVFIAAWYGLAVAAVRAVGSLAGRRALAW